MHTLKLTRLPPPCCVDVSVCREEDLTTARRLNVLFDLHLGWNVVLSICLTCEFLRIRTILALLRTLCGTFHGVVAGSIDTTQYFSQCIL